MTPEEVIRQMIQICTSFSAKNVYLYGSRAKGTCLERSDIDLAVSGASDFDGILQAADALDTLYTIDLLNLDTCRNKDLLEDIRLYGRKIYEKIS